MTKLQKNFMKSIKCALLLLLAFGLTSCHWVVLEPKGLIAHKEISLIILSTILMLLVVIPVIVMTFWFALRYRKNNTKACYDPSFTHSWIVEAFCWLIPCIIIVILAVITWYSSHSLDPYRPLSMKKKPIVIQAIALNWKWLFIYPEQNIATINYIAIPENTPINFQITASGPMNSLLIPQLAGQIYAMAGMRTKLHIISHHPGRYQGISANFSGTGFSDMKFVVDVVSEEHFTHWINDAHTGNRLLDIKTYNKLVKPSQNDPVSYFASVEPNLFNTVMMSYMMPMKKGQIPVERD